MLLVEPEQFMVAAALLDLRHSARRLKGSALTETGERRAC